jgi:two-component system cell cycle response regulator
MESWQSDWEGAMIEVPRDGASETRAGAKSAISVLLVEDEPDSAVLMAQILELEGYRVVEARNGAEALERVVDPSIRVALLDVMLPGIDGYEVCRRLRSDPRTARMPVAFISARSRAEDRAVGLEVGADVYLTKPISRAALVSAVKWLLDPNRVPGASAPSPT